MPTKQPTTTQLTPREADLIAQYRANQGVELELITVPRAYLDLLQYALKDLSAIRDDLQRKIDVLNYLASQTRTAS